MPPLPNSVSTLTQRLPPFHNQERKFFQSLYLRAYAPIVTENNLIGIIGCGPKLNDSPYTTEELELLIVIGQQVGTALRSARLIDDLRHLNTSMRSLNSQLQIAKQDLEKLDSIKTDFVTIASHELRTPLAQVRGYTLILSTASTIRICWINHKPKHSSAIYDVQQNAWKNLFLL